MDQSYSMNDDLQSLKSQSSFLGMYKCVYICLIL